MRYEKTLLILLVKVMMLLARGFCGMLTHLDWLHLGGEISINLMVTPVGLAWQ
jgi:hypothetical protein